jgi:hypothetical protein
MADLREKTAQLPRGWEEVRKAEEEEKVMLPPE